MSMLVAGVSSRAEAMSSIQHLPRHATRRTMVVTIFTPAQMHVIAQQLFEPCVLLINYTLMQYLMVFYWARRHEARVRLLFAVGLVGVVCIVPFAGPDEATNGAMNDVSEACCVLSFLIQITIIGRDLNKKIKFKTVLYLTIGAELLILFDLIGIVFSLLFVLSPSWLGSDNHSLRDDVPNILENITLAYIFLFRFYYIAQSLGWRELTKKRKVEIAWYLLFATHEVPFDILAGATGISWEFPQALWNRITLAGCLWVTARGKLRRSTDSRVSSTAQSPHQASRSSVGRASVQRVSVSRSASKKIVYAVASSRTASMEKSSMKRVDSRSLRELAG